MSYQAPSVLIVEDEPVPAFTLKRTLNDLGYRVLATTSNMADALLAARTELPNLALIDIVLGPREDGIELARTLRAEGELGIVFLTSFADVETVRRASSVRPNGYLVKPFGRDELFATVEIAMSQLGDRTPPPLADPTGLTSQQLNATLDHIAKHFDRNLSVVDLAARLGLSPGHFATLFKRSTGITPIQHVINERMREAKRLLRETDWSILQIASAVGFENQSYFSTRFKAEVGQPPARFRRT
jgi:YesN/AraC family two-component response regulator